MAIDLSELAKMSTEDQKRALHFSAQVLREQAANLSGVSEKDIRARQEADRNNPDLRDPRREAQNMMDELNDLRSK